MTQAMQGEMDKADLVVALGSRLEETARTGWDEGEKLVVQVNTSGRDFSAAFDGFRIEMDADAFLDHLEAAPDLDPHGNRDILSITASLQAARAIDSVGDSRTAMILREVVRTAPSRWLSVHENGLQDIWSYFADVWTLGEGVSCIAPSEQTPLGYGVSAALGAARIQDQPVVAIVGDSAFLTIGSELPHLMEVRAPLLYVVLDNGGFGWLQANYDSRESGPFCNRSQRLGAFAEACGLSAVTLAMGDSMTVQIQAAWDAALTPTCTGMYRPVVLCVAADLRDVPPGFEELAGDAPASGDHAQASSQYAAAAS
jgi:acetolactate synthase-1/2/3 large subunit